MGNETNNTTPANPQVTVLQGTKPAQQPQTDWFLIIAQVIRSAADALVAAYSNEKARGAK